MKTLLALALPLLAQSADRPAWDVAARWTCETTQLRICRAVGGDCTLAPNGAYFRIDFTTNMFNVGREARALPLPRASASAAYQPRPNLRLGERIAAREYLAGQDYPSGRSPGFSKLALDSGDSFAIATVPLPGGDGKSYEAILTRSQIDSQYLFYGACRPAD